MEHDDNVLSSAPFLLQKCMCARRACFERRHDLKSSCHTVTLPKVLTLDTPDRVRELPEEGCA